MRKKLIVANWKMNPQTFAEAQKLARAVAVAANKLQNVETVICPPFLWLDDLARLYKDAAFGGQDVFWIEKGAFTGEISPKMLKNSGVKYVIIGHSERRRYLKETDAMINLKIINALKNGLRVILCIGESEIEHRHGQTKNVLRHQLSADLKNVKREFLSDNAKLVVAYEPVWAIGTGKAEMPHNANASAKFIRQYLINKFGSKIANDARILYGGSTDPENILGFMAMPEISGALVGGSSLKVEEFIKMLRIANET